MVNLATRVCQAINEARAKMYCTKNSYKQLRQQIRNQCITISNTPNIQLMPLVNQKYINVYPVMTAKGFGGLFSLDIREFCFLGVGANGVGMIAGADISFDDFLIYICDYNEASIDYILHRAMINDPVTFDEVSNMDMRNYYTNQTVYQGQIVNASGNANVQTSVIISELIPPQYQNEYNALINYLKSTDCPTSKNTKISNFIQKLIEAGFGAVVGQIAQYLFDLV